MKEVRWDVGPVSPDALRWVANCVGFGATVQSVYPLQGGISSAVHGIEVNHNGQTIKLVLRQFVNAAWLLAEPDLALHEASSLTLADQLTVSTPKLVAYDEHGAQSGLPSVLMTMLPGSVILKPTNRQRWLHQLADALVRIHSLAVGEHRWNYRTYNDVATLGPQDWSSFPNLWEQAISIVGRERPDVRPCFIHRDYHPTNVLWKDDQITGVIDWVNACWGPAGIDVGHCRLNLALLYGTAAADEFLRAYQSLAGPSFEYDPYWDLTSIIDCLPGPPDVYAGWTALGVDNLTKEIMKERIDLYLGSVMKQLE